MCGIIITSAGIIYCDYQDIKPTVQPLTHCCFPNHSNQWPLCSRLWNYCSYRTITCPQMFSVLCPTTFMNKYYDLNWNVKVYKLILIFTLHNLIFPMSASVLLCVFKVRVPEDTSPWKDILQISAQDADTNSKLVYSIHSSLHPDSTKFFHLDPKSGVLVMTEELDYETISVHTLIVMVMRQLFLYNRRLWRYL